MKLLLDENLSRRIVAQIEHAYPESTQVALLNMDSANDKELWEFARDNGYTLVTQDADFNEMSLLYGQPPKVIWLRCGNQPRKIIVSLLLNHQTDIEAFQNNPDLTCLEVYS